MTNANIFEIATRNKFRFPFRGMVSVEDLWDLSPENLDTVFKTLNSQMKQTVEESLLATHVEEDVELLTKIEIVKRIVSVKLAEAAARDAANAKREERQRIMAILNEKQDEALHNKSVDELQAMLAGLDG